LEVPVPIIEIAHLVKAFRTPTRQPGFVGGLRTLFTRDYTVTHAVNDVTFAVEAGELLSYIGPNGAGKSTTFKMLTGVLMPTSGSITVNGLVPTQQRRHLVRHIGVVFGQRSQLWWDLPLADSLRILQAMYGVSDEAYQARLRLFNDILDLDAFLTTPVRQLSLGQRMRGELAAAFLHTPPLVLLDEPFLGLDVVAKEHVRQFIAQTNAEWGTTVLLASNDMADIERLSRRMLLIDKGQLLYDGTVEALKQRHAPYRTLVVQFAEDYADPAAADAQIVRREGRRVWFHFARTVNPQRLITELGGRYGIMDLAIEEPSLEEVIRGLYEHTDVLRTAPQEVPV